MKRSILSTEHAAFLADTFARNRARFGGFRMEGDGSGGGTSGGDAGGDQGGDKGGKPGDGDQGGDTGRTFSQADVTRIVEQRVGELTRRHQAEVDQLKADSDKDANGRLEAERDRANQRAEAAVQKAAPKVAQALAQVAAIAAGGRPDRAAAIVRVADLDGVAKFEGDDWTVDETKIGEALGKVLDEYPEWKVAEDDKGKGGEQQQRERQASGGDLGGGTTGGDLSLEAFSRLSMTQRAELKASDPEQYRKLADAAIDAARRR